MNDSLPIDSPPFLQCTISLSAVRPEVILSGKMRYQFDVAQQGQRALLV